MPGSKTTEKLTIFEQLILNQILLNLPLTGRLTIDCCQSGNNYYMDTEERSELIETRPSFLSALCILTFIGSTIGFSGHFLASLFFERFSQILVTYSSWHSSDAISPYYFTLLMVFFAISLIGAIRMWKLHRDGFFLYLFSQISILLIPVIWINWNAFSYTNAIFTTVFIFGYALNLKHMN